MNTIDRTNWKREPWVWLLIGLPLSAVIGGIITIYLAIVSSDGLVVDDYYKQGKEINQTLERDHRAVSYGLASDFRFDRVSGQLQLSLDAAPGFAFPAEVTFRLLHPTVAGRDRVITMGSMGDGQYAGLLPNASVIFGRWYIQLESGDWRLTGSVTIPERNPESSTPATFRLGSSADARPNY